MRTLYVCDTTSLIEYFDHVFCRGSRLSPLARGIFDSALCTFETDTRLSIPAVVFVEIFEKWCRTEEFTQKFYFEVFVRLRNAANVEIKPIERDVLEHLVLIGDNLEHHEMHDKIILASAISLQCGLITSDQAIRDYNRRRQVVPSIIY